MKKSVMCLSSISQMKRMVPLSLRARSAKRCCWTQTALRQSSGEKKENLGETSNSRMERRQTMHDWLTHTGVIWGKCVEHSVLTLFSKYKSQSCYVTEVRKKFAILPDRVGRGEVWWGHTNNSYLPWQGSKKKKSYAILYVREGIL